MVQIPASKEALTRAMEELLKEQEQLCKNTKEQEQEQLCENTDDKLPRINFDRHIYVPLLLKKADIRISPPALNESERRFVEDLCNYWKGEKDKSLQGKEIFLLRNLSRGIGVGFFEERGFYPDFILWIIDKQRGHQRIVFIEPHGMLYAKAYAFDEKARLHERLPDLARKISERSEETKGTRVSLDAFIISATPYEKLYRHYDNGNWSRDEFAKKHILFRENGNEYMETIFLESKE